MYLKNSGKAWYLLNVWKLTPINKIVLRLSEIQNWKVKGSTQSAARLSRNVGPTSVVKLISSCLNHLTCCHGLCCSVPVRQDGKPDIWKWFRYHSPALSLLRTVHMTPEAEGKSKRCRWTTNKTQHTCFWVWQTHLSRWHPGDPKSLPLSSSPRASLKVVQKYLEPLFEEVFHHFLLVVQRGHASSSLCCPRQKRSPWNKDLVLIDSEGRASVLIHFMSRGLLSSSSS